MSEERAFWDRIYAATAAGLDPLNLDDNPSAALALARWHLDNGHELTKKDREVLALALDGKLFGRGGQKAHLTPKKRAELVRMVHQLRAEGLSQEAVADAITRKAGVVMTIRGKDGVRQMEKENAPVFVFGVGLVADLDR